MVKKGSEPLLKTRKLLNFETVAISWTCEKELPLKSLYLYRFEITTYNY